MKTESHRTAMLLLPMTKQLDDAITIIASKDALAYSEIKYAQQRAAETSEYEAHARYNSGTTYEAEEARLQGELDDEVEIDKEDLDAITRAVG